jgi:hypothetical protein
MQKNLPSEGEKMTNEKKNKDSNTHNDVSSENEELFSNYSGVINDLNEAFHHNYSLAIQKSYERLGLRHTPVIIVSGDHVTLFHDGEQEMVSIIPTLYQQVKSISHVSFGIFVTLANNGFGPLADKACANLTHQSALIQQGLDILEQLVIPSEFIALQRDTLNSAAAVVRDVLESGVVEEEPLKAFGQVSAPLYLENAALAARLELDELHRAIGRWREQLGPEEWENVYVVICAAHQARYRETTRQYFQRLFHEIVSADANYENRVIYAEHIHDNDAALHLLARHLVDQKASIALFGNRTRLQEDLMSDGAAEYLLVLLTE